jgi:hypothetical protein
MNSTLQDIMGMIAKRKIKVPTDKDYIVSAAYTDAQEVLKPQPKMQANLINIGALRKYITNGNQGPAGPQGVQGPQGLQGVQGEQGIQGEVGAALTVLGSYPDLASFLAGPGGSPGTEGTAWIIESDGSLYVWHTITETWDDVGDLQGPQGQQGIQGIQGEQGEQGVQGIQGDPGPVGIPGLYVQTTNSTLVTNTTTESTLIGTGIGTLSVPANGFSVGDSFRGIFGGVVNADNNQTVRIRLRAGSAILLDSGIQNLGNAIVDDVWSLNVDFTIRQIGAATVASIVSLGSFHYTKTNNASVQGFGFNVVNNTTFDTTVSNTLNITVEWGTASTGNNIYSDIFVLNKTY